MTGAALMRGGDNEGAAGAAGAIGAPRIVRYRELKPCRTAFIDAHTPGSDKKENYTIIGGGVSEAADQHVHIEATPGFNIGAAGQPPGCRNSLHSHRTAEVFFVLSGRWRFFWGRHGDAGEVVLEEGDLFNIPTGVFRGFENVGGGYGMLMAVLGGDDAGGGVLWTPEVLEEAAAHGLVLGEDGRLYDSKKGEALPEGTEPMRPPEDLDAFTEPPAGEVVPAYVARRKEMAERARAGSVPVIGAEAMIRDRPGFELDFLADDAPPAASGAEEQSEVLMVFRGAWCLAWEGGEAELHPGDTCLVPPGLCATLTAAGEEGAPLGPPEGGSGVEEGGLSAPGLFRVRPTGDPAGATGRLPLGRRS